MKVLTINRVSGEQERIRVTIDDDGERITLNLSLADMMLALTGQAIILGDIKRTHR